MNAVGNAVGNAADGREEIGRSGAAGRAANVRSGVTIVQAVSARFGVTIVQAASAAGSQSAAGPQIAAGPGTAAGRQIAAGLGSAEDSSRGAPREDQRGEGQRGEGQTGEGQSGANLGAVSEAGLIVHLAGPFNVHRLIDRRLTAGSDANLGAASVAVLIVPPTDPLIAHRLSDRQLTTETGAKREAKAAAVVTERALTAREATAGPPVLVLAKTALAVPAKKVASGRGLTAADASRAANLVAGRGPIGRLETVRNLIDRVLKGLSAAIAARVHEKNDRSGNFVRDASLNRAKRAGSAGSRVFASSAKKADSGLAARAANGAIGKEARASVARASSLRASVSGASAAIMMAGRAMAAGSARIAAAGRVGDVVKLRG
jgi:hypothetical protein